MGSGRNCYRLAWWLCLCGSPVAAADLATVRLDPAACHLFASLSPESADFYALTPDGGYMSIDREHLGARVMDRGTWSQDEAGVVTLTSETLYRNAEFGRLSVSLAYEGPGKKWAAVTEALERFLATTREAEFSVATVGKIYGQPAPCCPDVTLAGISVDDSGDVPRGELEGLLVTLKAYPSLKDGHAFHLVPLAHKGRVFLEWQEAQTPINRNRTRMAEELDALRPAALPQYFFVGVDLKRFLIEAAHPQPFVRDAEMNDRVKNTPLPPELVAELQRIADKCRASSPPSPLPSPSPAP